MLEKGDQGVDQGELKDGENGQTDDQSGDPQNQSSQPSETLGRDDSHSYTSTDGH